MASKLEKMAAAPAAVSAEEYRAREAEFLADERALCENVPASQCNCAACPVRALCEWLCANDPNKGVK